MKKKAMMMSGLGLGLLGLGGAASADEVTPTQNYTVVAGDTVSEIATKFNTTIEKIDELNNLKDIDVISVGQILKVPTLKTNTNTNYVPVASTVATIQTQKPVQNTYTATQNTSQKAVQKQVQTSTPTPAQVKQSVQQPVVKQQTKSTPVAKSSNGGSVKQQFLAAGGTESMWNTIVMPESGGNPNAVSPNGYRGLGQTKEGWGTGSVASQTKGMLSYAKSRYGSVEGAVAFRQTNGWW